MPRSFIYTSFLLLGQSALLSPRQLLANIYADATGSTVGERVTVAENANALRFTSDGELRAVSKPEMHTRFQFDVRCIDATHVRACVRVRKSRGGGGGGLAARDTIVFREPGLLSATRAADRAPDFTRYVRHDESNELYRDSRAAIRDFVRS